MERTLFTDEPTKPNGNGKPKRRRCKYRLCRKWFEVNPSRPGQAYDTEECGSRERKLRQKERDLKRLVKSVRCQHGHPGAYIRDVIDLRK